MRLFIDKKETIQLDNIERIQVIDCLDIEGISEETINNLVSILNNHPMVEQVYLSDYPVNLRSQAFLKECDKDVSAIALEGALQLLVNQEVTIHCSKLVVVTGDLSYEEFEQVQNKIKW